MKLGENRLGQVFRKLPRKSNLYVEQEAAKERKQGCEQSSKQQRRHVQRPGDDAKSLTVSIRFQMAPHSQLWWVA